MASTFPWGTVLVLAGLFFAFWIGLGVFAVLTKVRGRPHTRRIEEHGGSMLLSSFAGEYCVWFLSLPVKLFTQLRVSPDVLSWLGLLLSLGAAPAVATGRFGLGGWLFMFGAMLDSVDGSVARNLGVAGDAGEFLDAVLDRAADMGIFLALFWYYQDRGSVAVLCGLALCASTLIPYMRAKAETMAITPARSMLRRPERVVYLGCGVVVSPILAAFVEPGVARPWNHVALLALALIAVLGTVDVVRMGISVRRTLRQRDAAARARA
jgi:phosphatidylglycerophosphate synthase